MCVWLAGWLAHIAHVFADAILRVSSPSPLQTPAASYLRRPLMPVRFSFSLASPENLDDGRRTKISANQWKIHNLAKWIRYIIWRETDQSFYIYMDFCIVFIERTSAHQHITTILRVCVCVWVGGWVRAVEQRYTYIYRLYTWVKAQAKSTISIYTEIRNPREFYFIWHSHLLGASRADCVIYVRASWVERRFVL